MPVVGGAQGNPYPTIESVMNLARVRVNDAMNDISGDLLTDDAPYTQTYLSSSFRWLQGKAYTAGVETPIQEIVLEGIPARYSTDTANQAYVTWAGCSDGVNEYEKPVLPQDLIQPLSVWHRQSNMSSNFYLMSQSDDGLPTWYDTNVYDWRQDGMYFYAGQFAQDFRIRYAAFWPDLDITKPQSLVRMIQCEDCLSARIAYEYTSTRKGPQDPSSVGLASLAETAFDTIAQRTSRRKQRGNTRRRPYGGGDHGYLAWPQYISSGN